ncbi:MAG: nuclease-related domain-containing protein [Proteobacteria bacterium]|nr:nuclease-related domain-containing protein [Pseudomonadota bacterium]
MGLLNSIKGWFGESAGSLAQWLMLDAAIYHSLKDVTILAADGSSTQIDHVIVSRHGIFVIEAKNMNGWIFGNEKDAQWTQSMPGGRKFRFQNPLRQNYRHTKVLSEFLGIDHGLFHSIVMFWGESTFKTPMPANVLSTGYTGYIKGKTGVLFSELEVLQIKEAIQTGRLPKTWATRREHIDSLKSRHDDQKWGSK